MAVQLTLLIVDDAPFIREVIKDLAKKNGITVLGEAEDGEAAVKLAVSLRPDVILMDIVMPKVSGIEATKRIIQEWPEAKVLALSTLDQELLVQKALQAGCLEFITKPFKSKELVDMIKKVGGSEND